MSSLLPDTQLLVWLSLNSKELPAAALESMQDRKNTLFFSLVSIWETSIKFALGRSDFLVEPRLLRRGLMEFGFRELPIMSEHVIAVSKLPHIHRDPFDRLLVAQAEVEGLTLMTTDKTLSKYGPHVRRF